MKSLIVTFSKFSRAIKIIERMYERRYNAFLMKVVWTIVGYVLGTLLIYILGQMAKKKWMVKKKQKKDA